jgi:hypothetical protein
MVMVSTAVVRATRSSRTDAEGEAITAAAAAARLELADEPAPQPANATTKIRR